MHDVASEMFWTEFNADTSLILKCEPKGYFRASLLLTLRTVQSQSQIIKHQNLKGNTNYPRP
jgi:hypothetical protein